MLVRENAGVFHNEDFGVQKIPGSYEFVLPLRSNVISNYCVVHVICRNKIPLILIGEMGGFERDGKESVGLSSTTIEIISSKPNKKPPGPPRPRRFAKSNG